MNLMFSYIFYCFFILLSFLPLKILFIFSDCTYYLVYYCLRYRRSVVRHNLENSFPNKTYNQILSIEKEFYRHLCDSFFETIKVLNMSDEEMIKRMTFKSKDMLEQYYDQDRSIILVYGHYCNWEWTTFYALHSKYYVAGLYKPLHNKVFDDMFKKLRSRSGAHTISKNTALRQMISLKNNNTHSMVAFIGDQTPKKKDANYWTEFLNQDTPVFLGAEKMAKMLDHVVVFAHISKVSRGFYTVDFKLITDNAKNTAEYYITETHTRMLDNIIQKEPSYWLWTHKRWKHSR